MFRKVAGEKVWRQTSFCGLGHDLLQGGALIAHRTTIGKCLKVGFGVVVVHDAEIGDNVTLEIMSHVGQGSKIGSNTTVKYEARIGDNCIIGERCLIGRRSIVADGSAVPNGTVVEDNTWFAPTFAQAG
ncbi:hypothetical protein HYX70_01810 [Candidatus Saccharibacteria bacterium]|nr:hypothetical protein [Candidatus Saccharibacteria bacterium]